MPLTAGVLTISDGCWRGEREDVSGRTLAESLEASGYQVLHRETVPDEAAVIQDKLTAWCESSCDVILTTGGTGFAPRDITPEATRQVIEREAPGLAELLRWTGYQKLDRAVLSRGVAGIRKETIIVNLPGSPGAVRDGLEVLLPLLPHASALLRESPVDHSPGAHSGPVSVPEADTLPVHDDPPTLVTLMETNLDDFSPEFYELTMERLFFAGALDVFLSPIQMKKGRPATLLSIIAPPGRAADLAGILFAETSAFGIRYQDLQRFTLKREWKTVVTPYGAIRIKIGKWQGAETSASPEYEDVKAASRRSEVPAKTVYAAALSIYHAGSAE